MKRWLPLLLAGYLFSSSLLPAQNTPGQAMFARIKTLVGNWQGQAKWTGARTDSYAMTAQYALTGYGSAVMEHWGDAANPAMSSVYHLDGPDLRMTHYCGTGHQPRLRATHIDEKQNTIIFSLVDVTNAVKPDAPFVQGAELRFHEKDHITVIFTFKGGGKVSYEHIDLKRVN